MVRVIARRIQPIGRTGPGSELNKNHEAQAPRAGARIAKLLTSFIGLKSIKYPVARAYRLSTDKGSWPRKRRAPSHHKPAVIPPASTRTSFERPGLNEAPNVR